MTIKRSDKIQDLEKKGWVSVRLMNVCRAAEIETVEQLIAAIRHIERRASKRFTKGDTRRAGIDMCISTVFDRFNQTTLF